MEKGASGSAGRRHAKAKGKRGKCEESKSVLCNSWFFPTNFAPLTCLAAYFHALSPPPSLSSPLFSFFASFFLSFFPHSFFLSSSSSFFLLLSSSALRRSEDAEAVEACCLWSDDARDSADKLLETLRDYFHLSVDLQALYDAWSASTPVIRELAPKLPGWPFLSTDKG